MQFGRPPGATLAQANPRPTDFQLEATDCVAGPSFLAGKLKGSKLPAGVKQGKNFVIFVWARPSK
jgi:hypothetical protein